MRVAILIDGGFFLRRLPRLTDPAILSDPERADQALADLVEGHLKDLNRTERAVNHYSLLYRCFFYDALPYTGRGHLPVSGRAVNYDRSAQAIFRRALLEKLRNHSDFALRLGEVRLRRGWIITERAQKDLLAGRRAVADLTDDDFTPGFQQKAVDMRIGLDIASITLKKTGRYHRAGHRRQRLCAGGPAGQTGRRAGNPRPVMAKGSRRPV